MAVATREFVGALAGTIAEAGYQPSAPGWPGDADTVEATRANPDSVANHGIDEVTNRYAKIIDGLPARPVIIGHSFGGLIAEKLLGMDYGSAAIGIDAAQIKGVLQLPLSQLRGSLSIFRQSRQQAQGGLADGQGVPLQLRQRPNRGGIRRPAPAAADPLARPAAVRSGGGPLAALAGRGQHRERGPH